MTAIAAECEAEARTRGWEDTASSPERDAIESAANATT